MLAAALWCSSTLYLEADAKSTSSRYQKATSAGHSHNTAQRTNNRHNSSTRSRADKKVAPDATPARIANGTNVGVAWSLPGKGDDGRNLNQLMVPASTMKVITSAAALTQLGPNFRFTTNIKTDASSVKPNSAGVLNGNLIIQFSGDPTLTSEKLLNAFKDLKASGIKKVKGSIIIDTSKFIGYTRGTGWPWDDLALCFAAPAGAVIIDHNCIYTKAVLPKGASNFSKAILTEYQPIKVTFDTKSVEKSDVDLTNCPLLLEPDISNNYRVTGCFNREINRKRQFIQEFKFAVQDPNQWARDIIRIVLRNSGISFNGNIRASSRISDDKLKSLNAIKSPELSVMLRHMLRYSDNLYAEAIANATGRDYFKKPVSIAKAAEAIRKILQERGKISFAGAATYDGSGLSSYNLITVRTMLQVLKYIRDNDERFGMIDLLPVAGENGTLLRRASVNKAPLKGNVVAKTGTIRHVRNLAGYVKTQKNHLVPFVIFSNAYSLEPAEYVKMEQEQSLLPHFEYERNVLQYLYSERRPQFK